MTEETNIPKDLQEIVREALGGKYTVTFARWVQQELKSDKTDTKILVLTTFRLLFLSNKSPRKVENNIPLLDISAIESKTPQKLVIHTEAKKFPLTTSGENNGRNFDTIILHVFLALSNIFPDISVEKLVPRIEISPSARLVEICERKQSLLPKDPGPCGNFSVAYRCLCDYRGAEVMEDVAWDVDNIYLAQDTREFCLSDFDYLDQRHILLMLSALQHNSWFAKLNFSDVKMTPEILSEVRKILKSNSVIRELILVNSGIRTELVGKLVKSLLLNSSPALCCLNLSGNSIEDKSVKSLCSLISSLTHGLVEMHLSGCALTSRGINSLGFAFSQSPNTCQNLRVLDLSENSIKGEDISNLHAYFTKENVLEIIRLTAVDCFLENLISSMYPGCCRTLRHLDLSGNCYGKKHGKDSVCPQAWKQFFSSAVSLKSVNLSGCRLPPDAVKSVLLGIACNEAVKSLKLNLSGNSLAESGASEVLEVSLPTVSNIASLDISDNSFDIGLASVLTKIAQNKCLKKLFIGRNLAAIKPKNVSLVMDAVVHLIQEEGSPIERLSLENMRLKGDTSYIINALGTNNSLRELDISGNQIGDSGAKMLSKALLINKTLSSISLDNNGITLSGFQELASAMERNYTVKVIPTPLNDVANAHRVNPEKTELAWKKISAALERNHNPRKLAMEQSFRLQQGLLITSYKEVLDSRLAKLDESIQKGKETNESSLSADVDFLLLKASCLKKDALATRQLILELQKVAAKSDEDGLIKNQLNAMAEQLQATLTKQVEGNISDMVQCAEKQCPEILSDKEFQEHLVFSVSPGNLLQKGFVQQLILEQVASDVANKMNELNLKVATFMSENMMEQLLRELKNTTNSLDGVRAGRKSTGVLDKETEKKDGVELRTRPSCASSSGLELSDSEKGQEKVGEKRKSRMYRGLRPQSSIGNPVQQLMEITDQVEPKDDSETTISPSPFLKQGFELPQVVSNHDSHQKLTPKQNKSDEMTLETADQKLSHLGMDRPKRLKNIAATRPTIGQRIEEDDELTKGVDEFFAVKYSSHNDCDQNGTKDKTKKLPAPLPTKPSKGKTAEESTGDNSSPNGKEKKKGKK